LRNAERLALGRFRFDFVEALAPLPNRRVPLHSQGRYAEAELQAAAAGVTIGDDYPLPGYCRPR
jgi:hypothetical protein